VPRLSASCGSTMVNPHAHIISRYVGWEWFGTLTWKGRVPPQGRRRKLWFAYLYEIAAWADMPFSSLFWVLRNEKGEKTDRAHFHFLLGNCRLPETKATAFKAMWLWEKRVGGGHARVSRWDPSLAGVDYVTKALGAGRAAGNLYELDRFRTKDFERADRIQEESIEASKSFTAWLARRARSISDAVPEQSDRIPEILGADAPRSDQETVIRGHWENPF